MFFLNLKKNVKYVFSNTAQYFAASCNEWVSESNPVHFGSKAEQNNDDGGHLDTEQSYDGDVELDLRTNVLLKLGQLHVRQTDRQTDTLITILHTFPHIHTFLHSKQSYDTDIGLDLWSNAKKLVINF